MNEDQLRVLTGWLNRSDGASRLLFELYARALYRIDRDQRFLGFDRRRYARFVRWRATSEGVVRLPGFSMQLELGERTRSSDYRYLPEENGPSDPYEVEVVRFLRAQLRRGMTFVDVGANVGYFSLLGASLVGPEGRVYAFEPDAENFQRLTHNVRLNGFGQLEARPVALGRASGSAELYLSALDSGSHSLLPLMRNAGRARVEVGTMDEQLPDLRADGIKIDVEGCEEDVLIGAHRTLERNPGAFLIFEYNKFLLHQGGRGYDGAVALLDSWGWTVQELRDDGTPGRRVRSHREIRSIATNLIARRPGGVRPAKAPVAEGGGRRGS